MAASKIRVPDVVVLLPGITGSVLAKDGKEIWAPRAGAVLRAVLSLGRSLRGLEVADDDWQAPDLGDGVHATRLMPDVHLLPGLWKIDGYGEIQRYLTEVFDLVEGQNFFPFPYDWRRDNRAAARRLEQRSADWLANWRQTSGIQEAQLVLIGHSMGGLISRYFVEALGGWRHTRAVITFGTPFYGSVNAVDYLLNGYPKGIGPLGLDLSDMLRSCRSIHQLVPSYRCVYDDGGGASKPADAKIPGWRSEWNGALLTFQEEMEVAARENRSDPNFQRDPVVYQPIVGTDQPTKQSVVVRDGTTTIEWRRGDRDEAGDGTVPLLSAALSGTEQQRTFAPEQHARLQNYDSMLAHLKGVLSSLYQVRVEDLRAAATAWYAFKADDVYLPDEPVAVQLGLCSAEDKTSLPDAEAVITLTNRLTGAVLPQRPRRIGRGMSPVVLGALPPGEYTITITGHAETAPVSDVLVVASPSEVG
jgi:pimeloyl-ACP methyl ester carboxylesterase